MSIEYKKRIFIDKAHNYLLRIDEDVFQKIVELSQKRQSSINTVLNEAIQKYIEK